LEKTLALTEKQEEQEEQRDRQPGRRETYHLSMESVPILWVGQETRTFVDLEKMSS
jgi:hypothetical protein